MESPRGDHERHVGPVDVELAGDLLKLAPGLPPVFAAGEMKSAPLPFGRQKGIPVVSPAEKIRRSPRGSRPAPNRGLVSGLVPRDLHRDLPQRLVVGAG